MRSGVLYRSGEHGAADEGDLRVVSDLGLGAVFDLRGNAERSSAPCRRPEDFSAEVFFFDGETGGLVSALKDQRGTANAEQIHAVMESIYAALPDRLNLLWIIRRYLNFLVQGEGATLIHCHAGKDRTGMAVDLLHHALGVHPDDAMADYLLTNDAPGFAERVAASGNAVRAKYGPMDDEALHALMGVDERYLLAARRAVGDRYGSADAFLALLGVDEDRRAILQERFVA